MRLRRVSVDWGVGRASLDLRGSGGQAMPIVGVAGENGSGKSMLRQAAIRLFSSSFSDKGEQSFADWKGVNAEVEFDIGSGICTGVMKNGVIVQRLAYTGMKVEDKGLRGGFLSYDNLERSFHSWKHRDYSQGVVGIVLSDLYNKDVRDSFIWVDDFTLGLDSYSARKFLDILIRKTLEKDNQLVVSCHDKNLLSGIGDDHVRILAGGTNVVDAVLRTLSKPQH